MKRLADHGSGPCTKDKAGRMNLARLAGPKLQRSTRNTLRALDPTLTRPVHEDGHDAEAGGDREALKVLCLASGVLGHKRDGRIEACQAGETTANESGKCDSVKECAETKGECQDGGGDAKRDLERGVSRHLDEESKEM